MICDCITCNSIEPRREGGATPFEFAEIRECLLKDVSSKILGLGAIANSPRDVSIHAVEMKFVQLRKAARVFLSSLDQELFIGFGSLTQVLPILAAFGFLITKTLE
jgi:hypothetical protein